MVCVEFEGNTYRYSNHAWYGHKKGKTASFGIHYPGDNCAVPLCMNQSLRKAAIESGISEEVFVTAKPVEKKKKKSSSKRKDPNSISIF